MMMHANATVTVCHTRTPDVPAVTREADIIVAASGQMESIGREYLREGQIVIDVVIGWNEEKQKLFGDVCFEEAEALVTAMAASGPNISCRFPTSDLAPSEMNTSSGPISTPRVR